MRSRIRLPSSVKYRYPTANPTAAPSAMVANGPTRGDDRSSHAPSETRLVDKVAPRLRLTRARHARIVVAQDADRHVPPPLNQGACHGGTHCGVANYGESRMDEF